MLKKNPIGFEDIIDLQFVKGVWSPFGPRTKGLGYNCIHLLKFRINWTFQVERVRRNSVIYLSNPGGSPHCQVEHHVRDKKIYVF